MHYSPSLVRSGCLNQCRDIYGLRTTIGYVYSSTFSPSTVRVFDCDGLRLRILLQRASCFSVARYSPAVATSNSRPFVSSKVTRVRLSVSPLSAKPPPFLLLWMQNLSLTRPPPSFLC
ncbi:hypothetical protein ACLOJK_040225 [Asimina triloba]